MSALARAARRGLGVLALGAAVGLGGASCAGGEVDLPAGAPPGPSAEPTSRVQQPSCLGGPVRSTVITRLAFTREEPKGVTPGFDLDGRVSDATDEASCKKRDFVSPDGRTGIDNQIAALIPTVESVVGNAVDGLIQGAINDGQLLIGLDFAGLDSWRDDECLGLTVRLAQGRPALGTDGVVEAYQTFALKSEDVSGRAEGGRIAGGQMVVGPMNLDIPLKLFSVDFILHVYDASFHFTVNEDGFLDGYLAGGIVPEELIDGIKDGDGIYKIMPIIEPVLMNSTDLARDAEGRCRQLSFAFAVQAVPVFLQR